MKKYDVIIHCDGSADSDGYGGAAALLHDPRTGRDRLPVKGFVEGATNQRMELEAAILGLSFLRRDGLKVLIVSDSRYLVDAFNEGWIINWKRKKWKKTANVDLWKRLSRLVALHNVEFQWVKGHGTNEGNIRVDQEAGGVRHRTRVTHIQSEANRSAARYRADRE